MTNNRKEMDTRAEKYPLPFTPDYRNASNLEIGKVGKASQIFVNFPLFLLKIPRGGGDAGRPLSWIHPWIFWILYFLNTLHICSHTLTLYTISRFYWIVCCLLLIKKDIFYTMGKQKKLLRTVEIKLLCCFWESNF